jgi:hypothetical protein
MDHFNYDEAEAELLPMSWRRLDAQALGPAAMAKAAVLATLMRDGVVFPAVGIITGLDGRFFLINGGHRFAASLLCGFRWIATINLPSSLGALVQ